MAWPGRTSSSPSSCSTCSDPLRTTVYSSKLGRWPGSTQPEGERMCATLTRSSCVFTRPAYSSMSFGLVPAASTRLGLSISCGIVATLHGHAVPMEITKLGPLNVSRICLGTMLMGGKTPPDEAHRMLDRYVEAGGNFLDTADVYGDGESERTLAPWLARHRDEVVVATKLRWEVSDVAGEGLSPERVRAACDASLKRLGTDVIDLYQVHAPDPDTPVEDTLEALDGLVRAGKVRALGASNFPAWLLAWSVALQDRNGWAPYVSL